MKAQKSGHIVNVSSVAGHKVRPGSSVYAATKAAVRMLSEGLRQEVKPYNIRTTVISPGAVASELRDSVTETDVAKGITDFHAANAISADSFARMVAFAMSQPEDVGHQRDPVPTNHSGPVMFRAGSPMRGLRRWTAVASAHHATALPR